MGERAGLLEVGPQCRDAVLLGIVAGLTRRLIRALVRALAADGLCEPQAPYTRGMSTGASFRPLVNVPIPEAIQRILGLIDQGASSSIIILNILAVTPDYVQRHLADVALQRGTASPDVARLRECLAEAQRATSGQAPTIPVQHVISRALLRRFCEVVRPKSGRELIEWVLPYRKNSLKSPTGAGFMKDFVKIDSAMTEELWATVENRLPEATDAAGTGRPPQDPVLHQVLRDAVTLHLVRNPRTLAAHDRTFNEVFARNVDRYAATPLADEAFRRRYGILPGGDEGRKQSAELLLRELRSNYESGALFRFRVEAHFERFKELLRQQPLNIVAVPPPGNAELLIGDGPVLAVAFDGTQITPAPLIAATHVVLPLTPFLLVVLGSEALASLPPDHLVEQINHLEVLGAERCVYHRPGVDFSASIARWLNWGS